MTIRSLGNPSGNWVPITPDDNASIKPTNGLYVGGSGDVRVLDLLGNDRTIPAMAGGIVHPLRCTKIFATGTTATGLFGLYDL